MTEGHSGPRAGWGAVASLGPDATRRERSPRLAYRAAGAARPLAWAPLLRSRASGPKDATASPWPTGWPMLGQFNAVADPQFRRIAHETRGPEFGSSSG